MNVPSISASGLTKIHRSHVALKDVSFSVDRGSVYALVGPNGAGKTTLINLLMNLQKPTSGTAQLLGTPSRHVQGSFLTQIGYISESQEMPEGMTVSS